MVPPQEREIFKYPKSGDSTIQIREQYDNFAILEVSRGVGPRALEEWLVDNKAVCFLADPQDQVVANDAPNTETRNRGKTKPRSNRPCVASHHYSAYLRSLVLVASSRAVLPQLLSLKLIMHCVVQGHVPLGEERIVSVVGTDSSTRAVSLEVCPSNTAGFCTLLQVENVDPCQPIASRQFRKQLATVNLLILGNAELATPFRGERLLMSTVSLHVSLLGEEPCTVTLPPPTRFSTLLAKEERFWQERHSSADPNETSTLLSGYNGEPVSFHGLQLIVNESVMIPRQGSQVVVERALALYKDHGCTGTPPRILDLGTGSGCLLLSLLHLEPAAMGVGVDVSEEALSVARTNADALDMNSRSIFCQGTFLNPECDGTFDIVCCNPPYHTRGGRNALDAATVAFEPGLALFVDGDDYCVCYRQVLEGLVAHGLLKTGSVLVFEVFRENAEQVMGLMQGAGFEQVVMGKDPRGCIRTAEGIFSAN